MTHDELNAASATLPEITKERARETLGSRSRLDAMAVLEFQNWEHVWRRIFAETIGTFLLVLVAAGAGVVSALSGGAIGRGEAVVAPGLMVMAIILSMGAISGAHLNPAVTLAFALRREFPWARIPMYLSAQAVGAIGACAVLRTLFGNVANLGATVPGASFNDTQAMSVEILLTFGLLTIILGTSSGAQNVGPLSAIAIGGYIALAGMWASPVSGASMNPIRSLGPDIVRGNFSHIWVYLLGPMLGMLAAVFSAIVLRGRGGDMAASLAAQGHLGRAAGQQDSVEHHVRDQVQP